VAGGVVQGVGPEFKPQKNKKAKLFLLLPLIYAIINLLFFLHHPN
jgi:hypothetical protein